MIDAPLKPIVRARLVLARGPHSASPAEVAAVHASLYPSRDAVCQTCPAELGKAYFAIKRWVDQQDNSPSTLSDSTVSKNKSTARFHSDDTTLFPHGLGISFSNDNLTDSAARYILKNDPEAKQFFKVLPPAAEGEEEFNPEAQEAQEAPATAAPASASAGAPDAGIDYAKLAAHVVDEQERRAAKPTAPALTASTGGADSKDNEHSDERPLPLSRQNKEQLVATYRAELKTEPGEDLLNDDLRDAITKHRAGQQDPE